MPQPFPPSRAERFSRSGRSARRTRRLLRRRAGGLIGLPRSARSGTHAVVTGPGREAVTLAMTSPRPRFRAGTRISATEKSDLDCAESEHHARDRFASETTLQRARMTTQPAPADAGSGRRLVAKAAVRSAEKSPERDRYRARAVMTAHAGAEPTVIRVTGAVAGGPLTREVRRFRGSGARALRCPRLSPVEV